MRAVFLPFWKKKLEKDIDFTPAHLRQARKKKRKAVLFSLLAVLLAAGLFLVYYYPQAVIRKYERELAAEDAVLGELEQGKKVYERLQAKKAEYDALIAVLREIEGQRI